MIMGKSILALAAIMVMVVSTVQASISCQEAIATLSPCFPFLVQGADKPSPQCCLGVTKVKDMGKTKPDLQALCECLKSAATSMKVDAKKAEALPGTCGVPLPFIIKPDIDCSQIGE